MKMRPGVGDEHRLEQRLGNKSWFWQTDYVRDERGNLVRRKALSTEEDLKAMALRTKPYANLWLYLSPRRPISGERDPPISEEDTRREKAGRRDDVAADARDKHDVPGPAQGGCAGN